MKSTGHEKNRYTVVLTVMADGTKLKPFIIFKRVKVPSNLTFPDGVVIHCNQKDWMDHVATKRRSGNDDLWVYSHLGGRCWSGINSALISHKMLLRKSEILVVMLQLYLES